MYKLINFGQKFNYFFNLTYTWEHKEILENVVLKLDLIIRGLTYTIIEIQGKHFLTLKYLYIKKLSSQTNQEKQFARISKFTDLEVDAQNLCCFLT